MSIKVFTIIFVILLLIAIIFLIHSFISSNAKGTKKNGILNYLNNSNILHNKKQDKLVEKLSFKEKVELSWKFLYTLTNKIMTSFSTADKERIRACGDVLKEYDMRYIHIVDSDSTNIIDKTTGAGKDIEQEAAQRKV